MKRILIALAILVFSGSIEAVTARTPRATTRKTKTSNAQVETYNALATEHGNVEASHGSIKDRISILKQNIREGHATLERTTQQIHNWTKELAPLEVQAHHEKSTRKPSAKAAPHAIA